MIATGSVGGRRGAMNLGTVRCVACLLLATTIGIVSPPCGAVKRGFTVADDIGFAHFGDPAVTFSPDGRYFLVEIERGLLNRNRPESTVLLFETKDVRQFILHAEIARKPAPVWGFSKSTYKDGPIITNIRWLSDSTGFAFLARNRLGNNQLFLAEVNPRRVRSVTSGDQDVTAFDVRDSKHFVYCVLRRSIRGRAAYEGHAISIVATGLSLYSLIFPEQLYPSTSRSHDLSDLWAVVNGRRFRVVDNSSGRPFPIHFFGQQALSLSPSGHSVVTALAVNTIPPGWETLYPPLVSSSPYRIRAGRQDSEASNGGRFVSQYVLIDLASGQVKSLFHSPLAHATGWWGLPHADWSADGKSLVLSNTFLPPTRQGLSDESKRPCGVVVTYPASGDVTCLERLKGKTEEGYEAGYHYVANVHFASGSDERVVVDYLLENYFVKQSSSYLRSHTGTWELDSTVKASRMQEKGVGVYVMQTPNDPPVLVATDPTTGGSRRIWDPNPQLRNIQLGEVSVFKWKDKTGREWLGGLYKPPSYFPGHRYPLVIQTHGFDQSAFQPGGIFTTANAAQELATAGILVLQVQDCPVRTTPEEGPCQIAGYEAAVEQLASEGLVDAGNVGIIGFSRTCYYVLEALTTSKLHFKAASITDGINIGYLEYLASLDSGGNEYAHEAEAMIGASPFGEGLQRWFRRSPEFNMNKVTTPLQVVALGFQSALTMWEPYAALRYLNKPVDLIVVPEGTHVLSSPAERMVSQGGTVDWFRFWLEDAEDTNPEKAQQYVRWREMRKMQ